jgi:hypothetical protein
MKSGELMSWTVAQLGVRSSGQSMSNHRVYAADWLDAGKRQILKDTMLDMHAEAKHLDFTVKSELSEIAQQVLERVVDQLGTKVNAENVNPWTDWWVASWKRPTFLKRVSTGTRRYR